MNRKNIEEIKNSHIGRYIRISSHIPPNQSYPNMFGYN